MEIQYATFHMLHIGLKYAEEIGEEGDPNPRYFCHLCKLHMDCNNVGLHFTSTAHRYSVLVREHCSLVPRLSLVRI